jgi:sigma-B regulation protein RsbU (phosphoserine phosphatase)
MKKIIKNGEGDGGASAPDAPREAAPEPTPAEIAGEILGSGFEGDYRPASSSIASPIRIQTDPLQIDFLMRLANALNTTLDLQALMHRTAELVRVVIDYKIFAILLLNDRTNDLRTRFQIGHSQEMERKRIRLGQGVIGRAAQLKKAVLVNDVLKDPHYVPANPHVRSELAVPLVVKNKLIGVIDIESEQVGYFQTEHMHLLELTASRVAVAVENARLYTRISRQAQTLQVLNEISQDLTSILDLDLLFERISQLLRRLIDYQMFSILLVDEAEQMLDLRFSVRFGEKFQSSSRLPITRGLVGRAVRERMLVNVPDVRKDERYFMINPETRSEMVVPLIYKSRVIGVLDLEHTRPSFFNEEHERMMITMAATVAISIENARLYQRVAHQEQRLEDDLAMAREVQLRLLPQKKPQHAHAEFATRFLPARTIGGDLYDFLKYDRDRTGIALGDASGKATPAALYSALVSGIMRAGAPNCPGPAEMLTLLNDSLQDRGLDAQYITMLYSVWNDENQTLQIANAGAVQPLFCRAGEVEEIQAEGFPLGLFPKINYEEFTLSTRPGDAIIFFSDGIVDAQSATAEMFGTQRLIDVVKANLDKSAGEIADEIMKEVGQFQGGVDRFDDETVVVLKVREAV